MLARRKRDDTVRKDTDFVHTIPDNIAGTTFLWPDKTLIFESIKEGFLVRQIFQYYS